MENIEIIKNLFLYKTYSKNATTKTVAENIKKKSQNVNGFTKNLDFQSEN